jgi:hypothetical protein
MRYGRAKEKIAETVPGRTPDTAVKKAFHRALESTRLLSHGTY